MLHFLNIPDRSPGNSQQVRKLTLRQIVPSSQGLEASADFSLLVHAKQRLPSLI
jgi:hypothetical protein